MTLPSVVSMCVIAPFAMIDALTSHALPKKRMMWVMNGHILADMGRMTLQWPPAGRVGASAIPPNGAKASAVIHCLTLDLQRLTR
ncbi:hypothetical protein VP03_31745 [Sinorhizobium meliloti]|nr:hypothetical protein VP03_31745 [Sinorhizobium meliloti]